MDFAIIWNSWALTIFGIVLQHWTECVTSGNKFWWIFFKRAFFSSQKLIDLHRLGAIFIREFSIFVPKFHIFIIFQTRYMALVLLWWYFMLNFHAKCSIFRANNTWCFLHCREKAINTGKIKDETETKRRYYAHSEFCSHTHWLSLNLILENVVRTIVHNRLLVYL